MDPVERRRTQNRIAQRRFRSKKASESGKKASEGTASTAVGDTPAARSTTFIPYTGGKVSAQTLNSAAKTTSSCEVDASSRSTGGSAQPASTDLLSSLSPGVQDMFLPDGQDDFSAAAASLAGFMHPGPDHAMSLTLTPRSSVAQGTPLIEQDDFSYLSSSLTDRLRDSLQSGLDTDMHANLTFTNSPDGSLYAQPSGPDSRPSFSLSTDQLTPSSLQDSSDAGSISVGASSYRIDLCQDCSALRIRSPPHLTRREAPCRSRTCVMSSGDMEGVPSTRKGGHDGEDFESSLHIAAESGHSDLVDMLIRSGSIVDESDSEGNTPLHRATKKRRLHVVQRLLWHGANPNLMNTAGRTPVHIAVSTGSMEIVETLVRFGGDVNRRARKTSGGGGIDSKHGAINET